ncbi:virulence factor BrkB family protein [Photobacterium phosphoreum]|uniref:virulence factor BrkB family protein n=1 Tax=Photobacterium phosphoreum TaxID=659 RepID=UPI000B059653|nr:virulence factor BrkB family protein [Photobacterium phosphoreum]
MADKKQPVKLVLWQRLSRIMEYFGYLIQRVNHDRLTVTAGSMAYVTLLSLVPLLTVVVSALSAIPAFAGAGTQVQQFVITNFVPAAGAVVTTYLNEFVVNAGKMTVVGIGALFVVAMMLISSIDKSLNYIWRVKKKRRWIISLAVYWMILTLGPILLGSSLALSSYLGSLALLDHRTLHGVVQQSLQWLPSMMSGLAFLLLYALVPNCKVQFKHALIGALCSSILFELSKKGFVIYLAHFHSYQMIYGALSVIPILFVWVYLCWCIVLLGAEITASLGERGFWDVSPSRSQIMTMVTNSDHDSTNNKEQ